MSSRLGAHTLRDNRSTEFRVWAPLAHEVELELPASGTRVAMTGSADGVFSCEVRDVGAGADYWFRIDRERNRPDPRSQYQPAGVHGPSRVVDSAQFLWSDAGFR